jgi:hypothetical protein
MINEATVNRAATLVYRLTLRTVIADVRAAVPGVRLREATVQRVRNRPDIWEFRYRTFRWTGAATCAVEAQASGWSAYLRRIRYDGY